MRIQTSSDLYALAKNAPAPQKNVLRKIGDATLDVVRSTTDYLDEHPLVKGAVANTFAATRGLQAFPQFIYPTIFDATAAERQQIYDVLDTLPLKDVNSVKSITVVPEIASDRPGWVTRGRAFDHNVTNFMELSRKELADPKDFRKVLIHETGHTRDFESAWFGMFREDSSKDPFGKGPYVTDYAKTNRHEDYAETYAYYHVDPEGTKAKVPEKYEAIRQSEEPNFVERLIDREEFRETGRWLGDNIASSRGMRNSLQTFYFLSGGLQAAQGLDQLRKATEAGGDPLHHFQGVLNVAAGVAFGSGVLALPGMAIHSAQRSLNRAISRGDLTPVDADAAVRLASDPIERVVRGVGSRVGVTAPFQSLSERFPKADPNRTRAVSIAAGGAIGGIAGTIAGPYGGVIAGYHIAGPVGGAVGLVVGALGGYALGTEVGGRVGGALAKAVGA